MVQCEEPDGYKAIELAHVSLCDENGFAISDGEAAIIRSTPKQWSAGQCVDIALIPPPVLRQENRSSFAAFPVLLTYQIAELPEAQVHIAKAPAHLSSPSSPEFLARSVILLI